MTGNAGKAGQGEDGLGKARLGRARQCRQDSSWLGAAGEAWRGDAGMARNCSAGQVEASIGYAGMEGRGGRGWERQCRNGNLERGRTTRREGSMEHTDIQEIRRILIRTAWLARNDAMQFKRYCKQALEVGDESALFMESGQRSWWAGYKIGKLHAAKLIRKQKAVVTNG